MSKKKLGVSVLAEVHRALSKEASKRGVTLSVLVAAILTTWLLANSNELD